MSTAAFTILGGNICSITPKIVSISGAGVGLDADVTAAAEPRSAPTPGWMVVTMIRPMNTAVIVVAEKYIRVCLATRPVPLPLPDNEHTPAIILPAKRGSTIILRRLRKTAPGNPTMRTARAQSGGGGNAAFKMNPKKIPKSTPRRVYPNSELIPRQANSRGRIHIASGRSYIPSEDVVTDNNEVFPKSFP
jgi:hypothetical protein